DPLGAAASYPLTCTAVGAAGRPTSVPRRRRKLSTVHNFSKEAEAMTNATPTAQLSDAGVSIWLDD
ncbi:MAG TPA: hypothetical protein DCL83_09980, partial [Arthrobacter bacterium]|nr:hypothetical protein [Arthrobacter sp.]